MVAHLNVPALEPLPNTPSSLSTKVVTDLLINEMDFNGLIFTDALNMKGAANYKIPGEVDLAAFLAGSDVLVISENVPKATQLIVNAYREGTVTEKRLAYSVKKILYAKYKVGLHKYAPVKKSYLFEDLNTVNDDALYEEAIDKFEEFKAKYNLQSEEILTMGDDLPDMGMMKISGISACPENSVAEIKLISDYISPIQGGKGAVRDVIEQVMKVQGKWLVDDTKST